MPEERASFFKRWAPEIALAAIALAAFMAGQGNRELWGKREQRAAAETIDTIDHQNWLVAYIQGRPRLEKPPLPRWITAGLMTASGIYDEWIVRFPNACCALGMVGLTYLLGRRWGGRSLGLSAGFILATLIYFVIELRQAGNDGMLAFWTTLALYCAWRRLHGDGLEEGAPAACDLAGRRAWGIGFWIALGLGFLTKGPVIILLALLTLVPYLAIIKQLKPGLRALWDLRGFLAFLALASSWPLAVVIDDPNAPRIWYLEMAMKAGSAGVANHRDREILAIHWPAMASPWLVPILVGVILPFRPQGARMRPQAWFAWSWAMVNLGAFCLWHVAKTNYYMPCMPAVALLGGWGWLWIAENARTATASGWWSRFCLRAYWAAPAIALIAAPIAAYRLEPGLLGPAFACSLALAGGLAFSAWSWRRGDAVGTLGGLSGGLALVLLLGFGVIAPHFNEDEGFRTLAQQLDSRLPADVKTLRFFHEIDEGLWFYLRGRELAPIPGTNPNYNDAYDLDAQHKDLGKSEKDLLAEHNAKLLSEFYDWVNEQQAPAYFLVRKKDLTYFWSKAPDFRKLIERRTEIVYQEPDRERNEIFLLRTRAADEVATSPWPSQAKK